MDFVQEFANVALEAQALSVRARHEPDKKARAEMSESARKAATWLEIMADELDRPSDG